MCQCLPKPSRVNTRLVLLRKRHKSPHRQDCLHHPSIYLALSLLPSPPPTPVIPTDEGTAQLERNAPFDRDARIWAWRRVRESGRGGGEGEGCWRERS